MSDVFDGVWEMNRDVSTRYDPATGGQVPETIERQVIRLKHEGDVQHYEVDVTEDGVTLHMGYSAPFGDPEWVPYTVYAVEGESDLSVGQVTAHVLQVKVDDRTHYRVVRSMDGSAQYVMERRLADDQQSYVAYIMAADGTLSIAKVFERQAGEPTMRYV